MKNTHLSMLSKLLLLLVAVLFFASIFFPIWRIELDAPQYPEGLVLQLHANKIDGDVAIINGLNHYIGMKTLHTEDFLEFKILPYVFGFFSFLTITTVFIAKKKGLYTLFILFLLFGVLSTADFYHWNYDYGHNLDPNAAIKVPGMAYQPPLLGYKQLLNFGAYSIPDIGGWMLIVAGLLMLIAILKETQLLQKLGKQKVTTVLMLSSVFFFSCSGDKAVPIKLNTDNCDFCKMTISDGKFGAELITEKGRVYKFDDIACMVHYSKENSANKIQAFYVHDYAQDNVLIPVSAAFFISGGNIKSPMHGNIIAFINGNVARDFSEKLEGTLIEWQDILNK